MEAVAELGGKRKGDEMRKDVERGAAEDSLVGRLRWPPPPLAGAAATAEEHAWWGLGGGC